MEKDFSVKSFCHSAKINYTDQIFIDSAKIFQINHERRPPDKAAMKYGNEQDLSYPVFKDEKSQYCAYRLANHTLKYQDLLETILLDSGFYHSQPLPDEMTSLVMVMLYDFQDRKFQPRCLPHSELKIEEVQDVETLLASSKIKLASAHARSRIIHGVTDIKCLLSEDVQKQEQRAFTIPLYTWINTAKTSLSEVFETLKGEGFTKVDSPSDLEVDEYCMDKHCQDVLVFAPVLRHKLNSLEPFIDCKLVLQDKYYNIAVHSVRSLMNVGEDIIVTRPCSRYTIAHLSALASQISCNIVVCGINSEARKEALQGTLTNMECKNVSFLKENFPDLDPSDPRLQKCKVILLMPRCSGSGVCDPVEFIVNENEDFAFIQNVSKGSISTEKLHELSKQQLSELCHAMTFNKVKTIVYSTCSVYSKENEDVISGAQELKTGNSKMYSYRLSLPAICSLPEISVSDKFIKVSPSDTTNGFFLAVLVKEVKRTEPVNTTTFPQKLKGIASPKSRKQNSRSCLPVQT
ncbi:hypothetical protein GDO86_000299, partial [Hymenochirus boettgeri]